MRWRFWRLEARDETHWGPIGQNTPTYELSGNKPDVGPRGGIDKAVPLRRQAAVVVLAAMATKRRSRLRWSRIADRSSPSRAPDGTGDGRWMCLVI